MRLRWRERPPAEVSTPLAPDERLLAWALAAAGPPVVATQRGLWLPAGPERRRIGWHDIDKATWSDPTLTVVEGVADGEFVADAPDLTVELTEPRDLPKVIRARVTASVAVTEHHPLPGGGAVRVVARRVSGQDGLRWLVRPDPGTDRHDPQLAGQALAVLAEVRTRHTPTVD